MARLAVAEMCGDSLRVLGQGLPLFLRLAALAALILETAGAAVFAVNWGLPSDRAEIDPRVLVFTTTPRQFAVIGAGILAGAVALSYAGAAAIQAAAAIAAGQRTGLREAIARVRPAALQLFWLQWVVNILAARFSPFAAPVLWLFLAPALPLAVLEGAGPMTAAEGALERLRGNWLRMLALQILLLAPVVIVPFGLVWATLPGGPLELGELPPLAGLAVGYPVLVALLLPVQLMFVALTLTYLRFAAPSGVHARGAGSVHTEG
jgi:hypothetical protein